MGIEFGYKLGATIVLTGGIISLILVILGVIINSWLLFIAGCVLISVIIIFLIVITYVLIWEE